MFFSLNFIIKYFIQNVLGNFYNHSVLKNAYLIIPKYGTNNNDPTRISSFNDGIVECLRNYEQFLGYSFLPIRMNRRKVLQMEKIIMVL